MPSIRTKDRLPIKDLSLNKPTELSQSSEVDSMDVNNDATPNGIHSAGDGANGVHGVDGTPPSSFVDDEVTKREDPSALTNLQQSTEYVLPIPAHDSQPTAKVSVVQNSSSDTRGPTTPTSDMQAVRIKDPKAEQGFAHDLEFGNGVEGSKTYPQMTRGSTPTQSVNVDDIMDISTVPEEATTIQTTESSYSMDDSAIATKDVSITNVELPHHPAVPVADGIIPEAPIDPATSPVPIESRISPNQDQIMLDAPKSPGKVARSREVEEEVEEGPAAKRTRTDDDDDSQVPEFKVPDLPQSATERFSPNSVTANTRENGTNPAPMGEPSPSISTQPMTKSQHRFLLKGLQNIRRAKDAAAFNAPVDHLLLNIPTYPTIITKPMDLRTMEDKIKAGRYSSVDDYVTDFDQVVQNSITFNGPEHAVTLAAHNIRDTLRKQLSNLPGPDTDDILPATKKSKKAPSTSVPKAAPPRRESRAVSGVSKSPTAGSSPQTFALGPQGVPLIRRDSTANDGRPKREIHPPAPRDLPYANQKPKKKKYQLELRFCQELVTEIKKPKYAGIGWPFANPVDPVALNIPHYHKVIKKPMDLRTIETKLTGGEYENAKEFEADVRLMFGNCYRFNPPTDDVHQMGKQYEAIFDEKWSEKKQWLDDHAPASGPQSPGSSPEPEDDEEEEEEEDDEAEDQLTILQKQIAAMSEQVKMIQKKKASPPASSKKVSKGSKPAKKEAKKSSTAPAAKNEKKGASKQAKTPKIPYVTYEQKQDISNRINSLPEVKMATALTIIRDNMPNLKVIDKSDQYNLFGISNVL